MCPLMTVEQRNSHDQSNLLNIFTICDTIHKEWVTSVGERPEMLWIWSWTGFQP